MSVALTAQLLPILFLPRGGKNLGTRFGILRMFSERSQSLLPEGHAELPDLEDALDPTVHLVSEVVLSFLDPEVLVMLR